MQGDGLFAAGEWAKARRYHMSRRRVWVFRASSPLLRPCASLHLGELATGRGDRSDFVLRSSMGLDGVSSSAAKWLRSVRPSGYFAAEQDLAAGIPERVLSVGCSRFWLAGELKHHISLPVLAEVYLGQRAMRSEQQAAPSAIQRFRQQRRQRSWT